MSQKLQSSFSFAASDEARHIPSLLEFRNRYTRPVRKVSSHFEYLENRSRGLDVTWQPVRGDLIAHP
jgi:hypothetical protein